MTGGFRNYPPQGRHRGLPHLLVIGEKLFELVKVGWCDVLAQRHLAEFCVRVENHLLRRVQFNSLALQEHLGEVIWAINVLSQGCKLSVSTSPGTTGLGPPSATVITTELLINDKGFTLPLQFQ